MDPIDKDIEVAPQLSIRVEKVRAKPRVLLEDIIQQVCNTPTHHREFTLVIHIVFHQGRESDKRHINILHEFKALMEFLAGFIYKKLYL